jgi:adenosylhomocysteinase
MGKPTSPGDPSTGALKVGWVQAHMPVLEGIRSRLERERTFQGFPLGLVLHVEAKTAALALALQSAGASVVMAASNPLSTDDDVVAHLLARGLPTFAVKGESVGEYRRGIQEVLDSGPKVLIDDGADLVAGAILRQSGERGGIVGSTEETTTGVIRLRSLHRQGKLPWPAIDVNDAAMKHLFDNRYGTGQSTLDGLFSATNRVVAGRTVVVAGYGWCGKGVASRCRGMGAQVIVTEVDPVRALEARLEGFEVRPMLEAAPRADFVVTVTGCADVVRREHLRVLKDKCVLANAGHFDVEINKKDLEDLALDHRKVRPMVEEYRMADGRRIFLLAEGRLINLAAGQGHPVEIMDLSFSLQALSAEHLRKEGASMEPGVHPVPARLDREVAHAALRPFGVALDELTKAQQQYLAAWETGT